MIVAATGHRPDKLGGYSYKVDRKLISLAIAYLTQVEPERVITGMALGWDTAFAIAAYSLGIPFIAAVPFTGQEGRWEEAHQKRYHEILGQACEVVTVSRGGFSARAMEKRNQCMVDHAARIAALWDGSAGGTGNCVRYAAKKKVDLDNLWTRFVTGRHDLDFLI
ncbi:UNVERIFIED_ORG: SLOG family protein [Roseateles sp. XES5]|nr:SLOG family protein [Roseateles sp. XES5]